VPLILPKPAPDHNTDTRAVKGIAARQEIVIWITWERFSYSYFNPIRFLYANFSIINLLTSILFVPTQHKSSGNLLTSNREEAENGAQGNKT
jgi:hypothetical protein